MAQSIKISDIEMASLREEAKLSSRSIAGQVEHWLRIGRAIESSPNFKYSNIKKVLAGLGSRSKLTLEEQEVYFDEFFESLWTTTPEQETYFADRRKRGVGTGMDENGRIVHQIPEK